MVNIMIKSNSKMRIKKKRGIYYTKFQYASDSGETVYLEFNSNIHLADNCGAYSLTDNRFSLRIEYKDHTEYVLDRYKNRMSLEDWCSFDQLASKEIWEFIEKVRHLTSG